MHQNGTAAIDTWPEQPRAAAQLVIERYGEPHEVTDSYLEWNGVGPWKRIVASRAFCQHDFPAPHFDSIESVLEEDTADPDERALSGEDLERAERECEKAEQAA